jgi:hypothetical protein
MQTYKIIRFYKDINKKGRIKMKGLSLSEAQAYCKREDTHKKDINGDVIWFDGYDQE